jgi:hypothetical protein
MGALAGQASVKLAVVLVSASIDSLKLAVMSVLIATPVALASGAVELTVGAVVSGATPVVKVQVKALASALPATSLTSVVIRAAQVVLAGRSLAGVKVAILPLHDAVDFPHHLPRTVDITTKADHVYIFVTRSRNALPITDTELRLIAAAATMGDSSRPNIGYSTPAATGMPRAL